mmetsp:Transcript_14818/g.43247  ORF Transcript_14818/g.43247 Transcript_14818/m.43247 type:complete len:206 (+) Transcript_14818:304-921(+)
MGTKVAVENSDVPLGEGAAIETLPGLRHHGERVAARGVAVVHQGEEEVQRRQRAEDEVLQAGGRVVPAVGEEGVGDREIEEEVHERPRGGAAGRRHCRQLQARVLGLEPLHLPQARPPVRLAEGLVDLRGEAVHLPQERLVPAPGQRPGAGAGGENHGRREQHPEARQKQHGDGEGDPCVGARVWDLPPVEQLTPKQNVQRVLLG